MRHLTPRAQASTRSTPRPSLPRFSGPHALRAHRLLARGRCLPRIQYCSPRAGGKELCPLRTTRGLQYCIRGRHHPRAMSHPRVCSERVERRTAAGWAGAPSRGRPEREWARWRKPKPARDTSVRSEPSKSLGIYLIPALGRADGRSSPTIGPPHSASASRTTVGLRLRGGLEVN